MEKFFNTFHYIFLVLFFFFFSWWGSAFVKPREHDSFFTMLPFQEAKRAMNNYRGSGEGRLGFAKIALAKNFIIIEENVFVNDRRDIRVSIFREDAIGGVGLKIVFLTERSCLHFVHEYASNAFFSTKKHDSLIVSPWFSKIDFAGSSGWEVNTFGLKSINDVFSEKLIDWCSLGNSENRFIKIHGF